ncbi:hypothetical protein NK718_04545 [Alsobacter sp. SYSU M60028]|uniref:Acetylmuramidase n=1 Tax=Alsobacter ponti TaxID=2962936 RepID=A0ABT1L8J3_9HYPH|nr:glycosyl hydrolase 108 family protein [Alsobacter ponti]MCP8937774.1 hypothetical protein [Alsobacter ponti]
MKDNYDIALAEVLRHEGGWSDHRLDPGGPTQRGVTLKTLAAWRGRPVSRAELMALGARETAEIYRALYWDAVRGDDLPAGIDLAVFDLAVNSGPRRAVTLLQRALGVTPDGALGPLTLAAARGADPARLAAALAEARRGFLRRLAGFAIFGRGWERRVAAVTARAVAITGAAPPKPSPAPVSTSKKENFMDGLKSILGSRTVLSNIVGLAALAFSALGFQTSGVDTGALTDAILQAIAAGGFIASTVFRVLATKKLV